MIGAESWLGCRGCSTSLDIHPDMFEMHRRVAL
jgi:hypothetical protein